MKGKKPRFHKVGALIKKVPKQLWGKHWSLVLTWQLGHVIPFLERTKDNVTNLGMSTCVF